MDDIKNRIEDYSTLNKIYYILEYDKWIKEIPSIQFPSHWFVQIIPPFAGGYN